ncbi:SdpI family protein [Mucilaginibacter polytrichastri]|uniref:DUF1648 domain-containing protein n=1 Tax=Mucilaginibacter polytrichastri TaxID=1302689 RepID=A0A1Q6A2X4_9SPHI|nr:SdpI family protein [Mucilaginibacter polytrichastri]OKS88341.1 hypothetical protein RG47T_3807 [Mucilaginibacter polytrichastri]SFT13884.1 Uncharacterized membrane protein [Mucilaginibacter polytrichastri]
MKKFNPSDLLLLIIWVLPFVYLAVVYKQLPETVPIHFGIQGKPDGFGPRADVIFLMAITGGASAAAYLLMRFLPSIDPKRQVKYGEDNFNKIGFGIVSFLSLISLTIIYAVVHNGFKYDNLEFVIISLLFVFLGNMMYNVKPNYFVGIRIPWTLESEDNWRATHRLAGKLWVGGGIVLTALMLIIHGQLGVDVFLGFIALLSIVPMVYSYRYFKMHTAK